MKLNIKNNQFHRINNNKIKSKMYLSKIANLQLLKGNYDQFSKGAVAPCAYTTRGFALIIIRKFHRDIDIKE